MINNVSAKAAFSEVQKREAELARLAQKTGDTYVDKEGVVAKDSLSVAPGLEKQSSEELTKLYETYNTDGQEGLAESEFEALFNSVVQPESEPAAASTPQTVTVNPGDTLSRIARQHGVSLAELKEANPTFFKDGKDSAGKTRSAAGNLIYPGDQVTIPQKATPAVTSPSTTPTETGTEQPAAVDTAAAVARIKERSSGPDADQGQTWADYQTTTKSELNFGHEAVDGSLWKKNDQDDVVWSDNDKAVSWNQINAMPEAQRQAYFKQAGVDPAPAREVIANNPAQAKPEGAQQVQLAKETIDSAALYELDPEAAALLSQEDLQVIKEVDQKTVDTAKAALEQIPSDDSQRFEYEGKVQVLEAQFETKYAAPTSSEPSEPIQVDENIDDNEARRMVSSRTPEQLDELNLGTRIGMIKAMERGITTGTEDQAIGKVAQSIARTHPEALTPEVVRHMDDNGVREFIKGSSDEGLDKLPGETRAAMIGELAEGYTSSEEDQMIGQLGASMARNQPEALTPAVIGAMDDNGVRAMMGRLSAEELATLPSEARQAMIEELAAGATSSEEDVMIGRIGGSLATTHPAALTPELVRRMDDNGVRLMTKDMSVPDLAKLPQETLEAMRQELRAGWTTEEEYVQIDKIAQALRYTP
jgi:LysM repeat protein